MKFNEGLTKIENIEATLKKNKELTIKEVEKEYIVWKEDYMKISYKPTKEKKRTWGMMVRCKETKQKMTIREAADFAHGCISGIRKCCLYKEKYKGFHFMYCKK